MEIGVIFQSPTGQQQTVWVTERSSEEATMRAAAKLRPWLTAEGWLPVALTRWL